MNKTLMNKEDFKILINSYGADLMRWPESLRPLAAPLFTQYPTLVKESAALDDMLDSYKVNDISPDFLENMIDAAHAHENDNMPVTFKTFWAKAAMMTACAIFGFYCGNISLHADLKLAAKEMTIKPILFGPTNLSELML